MFSQHFTEWSLLTLKSIQPVHLITRQRMSICLRDNATGRTDRIMRSITLMQSVVRTSNIVYLFAIPELKQSRYMPHIFNGLLRIDFTQLLVAGNNRRLMHKLERFIKGLTAHPIYSILHTQFVKTSNLLVKSSASLGFW
eukprot:scaffold10642_cov155-Skeletonema_dohrnii-CCMP3373.AAC.8